MSLKALVVDDEAPARSELRYLLGPHQEVEVVGEAATAQEALELASAVRYDVVFCDIELPGLSGLDAARLVRDRPAVEPVEKVPVVSGGKTTLLDYDEIHFVRADGDYCRVHTYDRSYLSTASLRELEDVLPSGRFARVHRSHLVNLAKVASVRRSGEQLLLALDDKDRTEVEVARRQSRALRERLRL